MVVWKMLVVGVNLLSLEAIFNLQLQIGMGGVLLQASAD
jgi:hypothetical protein